MELKKELEYQQLVKYIDERHAEGIPYRKALDEVYKFYKPWHETDFRVRTMLVKLKKNLDKATYQLTTHLRHFLPHKHECYPEIFLTDQ